MSLLLDLAVFAMKWFSTGWQYETALGGMSQKEEILLFPGALQNMTAVREEKHLVIETHCICHLPEYGDRYIVTFMMHTFDPGSRREWRLVVQVVFALYKPNILYHSEKKC